MTGWRTAFWEQSVDQSDEIRRTDDNERLHFHGFPWRSDGFCGKENRLRMRLGMLEAGQNTFDMDSNLWENRNLLLPAQVVSHVKKQERSGKSLPVVSHIQHMFLGSNGNCIENLLPSMLADVITNHDAVGLWSVRKLL